MKNEKYWETWSEAQLQAFQEEFLAWYEKEKRNLPWRVNLDPYRIWISEIMLQQTRVDTVIDYYYRFMEWFPTIKDLAEAPDDKLLKAWEGLGYYSRARNLKVAAQQIMTEFDGQMPETIEEIRQLKGIGPYTAGAIGSIAFHIPEPAIDGNVMRVVSRLFEISDDIAKPSSRKVFEAAMYKIIDQHRPGDFNQAMMDLGSSICTPTSPKCEECPIQSYCLSYKNNTMTNYPVKSKKLKPKDVYYIGGIIENKQQEFLLQQRNAKGLLANMWLFPIEEVSKERFEFLQKTGVKEEKQLSLDFEESLLVAEENPEIFDQYSHVVWQKRVLGEVTHIFSHLKWHILVFYGRKIGETITDENQAWATKDEFSNYVFPKPQQKMVELYKEEFGTTE
ncbi:A/G-specific adenine glycosylase [Enterococcus ureilyticus]|uniref:Adenine DNA glycosylase n=1 Tax=Enterococcus ureilyticus TaxID=1131292 RepID=A0A1E5H9W0_9ENTE|nr:A/G-specific adenine glycosylase [Enterococcus ureilyticus]MBM7688522.1 A/G-specific adenine glycosylase [Enterococcus ureilyticus]MBO0445659.1 A/G-specific adenine glycosylase [Enterococcus ureilyticus]OEG21616.1 A/G-specific adenine glycosylase [Enterococcus ureilyticus]